MFIWSAAAIHCVLPHPANIFYLLFLLKAENHDILTEIHILNLSLGHLTVVLNATECWLDWKSGKYLYWLLSKCYCGKKVLPSPTCKLLLWMLISTVALPCPWFRGYIHTLEAQLYNNSVSNSALTRSPESLHYILANRLYNCTAVSKAFFVHTGRRSVTVIKVLDVFLCFCCFTPAPTESVIRIQ